MKKTNYYKEIVIEIKNRLSGIDKIETNTNILIILCDRINEFAQLQLLIQLSINET